MIRIISFEHVDPKRENCWSCEEFKNALIPKATINSEAAPIHIIKRTVSVIYFISSRYNTAQNAIKIIKLYNILITPTNLKFILITVSNKK